MVASANENGSCSHVNGAAAATKVLIIGAAGMDYHVFNRIFRGNPHYNVVAFTAAVEQNLGTTGDALRTYPPELAGKELYPKGIPTIQECEMADFIKKNGVQVAIIAYSDLPYEAVMHKGATVLAAGANYWCVAPKNTMIKSKKPVVAVCAVRTGCGKSQTSTKVSQLLKDMGKKVVAVREPMPYGDLVAQTAMRFATAEDLDRHKCTVEEREEYEQYVDNGLVIYSGVDYEEILRQAEEEADVVVWDGGNNEVSFFVPDVLFVVADPLRPGHEASYYPGEVNARMADYFIINKENSATSEQIATVLANLTAMNPSAGVIHADSVVTVDDPAAVCGKTVLLVEDGPTLTHGDMAYGAAVVAARQLGCTPIDPRPICANNSLGKLYTEFPHLAKAEEVVLPAMGYSKKQLTDLEDSINAAQCDLVLSGTPFDLSRVVKANKPIVRVRYAVEERKGSPLIKDILAKLMA